MSYYKAKQCLEELQQYARPETKPIEFDLASALINLSNAIDQDFQSLRSDISSLRRELKDLKN